LAGFYRHSKINETGNDRRTICLGTCHTDGNHLDRSNGVVVSSGDLGHLNDYFFVSFGNLLVRDVCGVVNSCMVFYEVVSKPMKTEPKSETQTWQLHAI
jgi:hypothetical protein